MKDFLSKVGKRGRRVLLAGLMTPAMTACGHTIDPTMAQLPTYDMPAAVVVKTPPARLNAGGVAYPAGAMPAPVVGGMPAPAMVGSVMGSAIGVPAGGPTRVQMVDGMVSMASADGATVIQQAPMTVQNPAHIIPQPPIWVGNPPIAIPSPPVVINQPGFILNHAEVVVHPPRVEFVETVVMPTQVIAAQPVYTPPPPPPPPPKYTPPPAPPKPAPPPPLPKVEPIIPKEEVLPPK